MLCEHYEMTVMIILWDFRSRMLDISWKATFEAQLQWANWKKDVANWKDQQHYFESPKIK